jgi:hypothetical protein
VKSARYWQKPRPADDIAAYVFHKLTVVDSPRYKGLHAFEVAFIERGEAERIPLPGLD